MLLLLCYRRESKQKCVKRQPSSIRWSISRSISHEDDQIDDTYLGNTDSIIDEIKSTHELENVEKVEKTGTTEKKQEGNIIEEEEIENGEVIK